MELVWAIEPEGGLRLAWTERGGPPVMAPPTRRGFGSKLIQAAVRHQLSGEIDPAWKLEGLHCELQVAARCIAAVGLSAPASAAAVYAQAPPALAPVGSPLRRHRVLVVEDEALMAMETVAQLEQLGAEEAHSMRLCSTSTSAASRLDHLRICWPAAVYRSSSPLAMAKRQPATIVRRCWPSRSCGVT